MDEASGPVERVISRIIGSKSELYPHSQILENGSDIALEAASERQCMHELSIAISMIDQIIEESESRGGLQVEVVHLKLGVFSGVDKHALLFSYTLACEGTALERSRLVIETMPLVVYCPACKENRTPPSLYEICCPDCFTPTDKIISGREMEVAYLEVAA